MPIFTTFAAGSARAFRTGGGKLQLLFSNTGNTTVSEFGGYRVYRITGNTIFNVDATYPGATIEMIIVGGGGGGNSGSSSGPGGGAGGLYWNPSFPVPAVGSYNAIIGAGGVPIGGAFSTPVYPGGDSSLFGVVAVGGGGGGLDASNLGAAGAWSTGRTGMDGGSGAGIYNGGTFTSPYDGALMAWGRSVYNGNTQFYYGNNAGDGDSGAGGGGGGAGSVGTLGTSSVKGGDGGAALAFTGWDSVPLVLAGGGGGGVGVGTAGIGGGAAGITVGGSGGVGGAAATSSGVANTGGGGGGSGSGNASAGGSGVIYIRHLI
jgi:hypothetical protein